MSESVGLGNEIKIKIYLSALNINCHQNNIRCQHPATILNSEFYKLVEFLNANISIPPMFTKNAENCLP